MPIHEFSQLQTRVASNSISLTIQSEMSLRESKRNQVSRAGQRCEDLVRWDKDSS